jgi:hypothetical protein
MASLTLPRYDHTATPSAPCLSLKRHRLRPRYASIGGELAVVANQS